MRVKGIVCRTLRNRFLIEIFEIIIVRLIQIIDKIFFLDHYYSIYVEHTLIPYRSMYKLFMRHKGLSNTKSWSDHHYFILFELFNLNEIEKLCSIECKDLTFIYFLIFLLIIRRLDRIWLWANLVYLYCIHMLVLVREKLPIKTHLFIESFCTR